MVMTKKNVTVGLVTLLMVGILSGVHPIQSRAQEIDSYAVIKEACTATAICESNKKACVIDIENSKNPYDVEWDYGAEWEKYVKACDWSLVFDAEYYKKTFPMLALQYNYDDDLLLRHFQTVGVHEGRQGSAKFNVEAYAKNCKSSIFKNFKSDVEGFYIYYMLHYDTESEVNTTTLSDGSKPKKQLFTKLTAIQKDEVNEVNSYRVAVKADEVQANSELMALANYRAYINRVNGYVFNQGHDWAKKNKNKYIDMISKIVGSDSGFSLDENTVTSKTLGYKNSYAELYAGCKSHYEAMTKPSNKYIGVSNSYVSKSTYYASQYDLFLDYIEKK